MDPQLQLVSTNSPWAKTHGLPTADCDESGLWLFAPILMMAPPNKVSETSSYQLTSQQERQKLILNDFQLSKKAGKAFSKWLLLLFVGRIPMQKLGDSLRPQSLRVPSPNVLNPRFKAALARAEHQFFLHFWSGDFKLFSRANTFSILKVKGPNLRVFQLHTFHFCGYFGQVDIKLGRVAKHVKVDPVLLIKLSHQRPLQLKPI